MKLNKILLLLLFFIILIGVSGCNLDLGLGGGTDSPSTQPDLETEETTPEDIPTEDDIPTENPGGETTEAIDYVAQTKLDLTTDSLKQEVTVKVYVDGDTTHFNISNPSFDGETLKARYLGVNTPESTGQIEPYGKTAANFTKEKLSNAQSIIIESDNNKWNADSTGGRYLVWVWYRTDADSDYRNLNIELLQNGLAIASNSADNRYGEICMAAIAQAKALKLNVQSNKKDPTFYYGDAIELTLKELRVNIEEYNGKKVAFEGVVTKNSAQTVYVEEYDEATDTYFGMTVYYGYSASGNLLSILSPGNRVRIVGKVSYYETGGTYQVSDLKLDLWLPNHPDNTQLISEGNEIGYRETSVSDFNNKKVVVEQEIEGEIVTEEFSFAQLSMNTSISMKNLQVVSIYTTTNEESSSIGAMTLTCKVGTEKIDIRTIVLYDEDGNKVTAAAYEGKNINVKGLVDYFNGSYQIKVFSVNDITINE